MTREVITGTLHRSRTRKGPRNWIADYFLMTAEAAGLAEPKYFPERGYISGDTLNTTGKRNNVWSLTSLKPFGDLPSGTRVKFTATVERWDNGMGGKCRRVRDVEVLAAVQPAAAAPEAP